MSHSVLLGSLWVYLHLVSDDLICAEIVCRVKLKTKRSFSFHVCLSEAVAASTNMWTTSQQEMNNKKTAGERGDL